MCVHIHVYVHIHVCVLVCTCVWEGHFPGVSAVKNLSACKAGDPSSVLESGRSPGKRNGNPLQYSPLENPVDGGACRVTVRGVTKSQTQMSD